MSELVVFNDDEAYSAPVSAEVLQERLQKTKEYLIAMVEAIKGEGVKMIFGERGDVIKVKDIENFINKEL